MLEVKNLKVAIDKKVLLNDFSLKVNPGELHVIMGRNGAGKSSFAKAFSGHPAYQIKKGEILFLGKKINQLLPEERALMGSFVSFQYPLEIAGLSNFEFLKMALNAKRKKLKKPSLNRVDFEKLYLKKGALVGLRPDLLKRDMNSGFSGGERKKNELLQMALLEPKLAILDEIDSGLDIDALKEVASAIEKLRTKKNSVILITHYQRILNYLAVDYVHILENGKLIKSGGRELAEMLEEKGYEFLLK